MLDRHEPYKSNQAKLLTDHLSRQRVLPSTEEKLHQHIERKAKREACRLLAATEAEHYRQKHARQAAAAQQENNAAVVQTFAKRAREAVLAAGASNEEAEAAATVAAANAQITFEENAMQE